jgi:hypothetical protein
MLAKKDLVFQAFGENISPSIFTLFPKWIVPRVRFGCIALMVDRSVPHEV